MVFLQVFFSRFYAAGEPMAFLNMGAGARATGMGGAFVSVADDTSAVLYNPAGIVGVHGMQLAAETYILSLGRSVNYMSICKPFDIGDNVYSTAISWLNYSAGRDIEKRTTNSNDPDSLFSDVSHFFIFTAAAAVSKRFYAGANIKLMLHYIGEAQGTGVGFDAGAFFKTGMGLDFGLSVMNISANMNWDNSPHVEKAAPVISAGASYNAAGLFRVPGLKLLLSGDILYNSFGYLSARAGVEASGNGVFFIRAGYSGAPAFGVGIKLEPSQVFAFRFDYAFIDDIIIPGAFNHRLGVTVEYIFPHRVKVEEEAPEEKVRKREEGRDYESPW